MNKVIPHPQTPRSKGEGYGKKKKKRGKGNANGEGDRVRVRETTGNEYRVTGCRVIHRSDS